MDWEKFVEALSFYERCDLISALKEPGLTPQQIPTTPSPMPGVNPPQGRGSLYKLDSEEMSLGRQGEKIKAIKHIRERTYCGLKEAKDAYERVFPVGG